MCCAARLGALPGWVHSGSVGVWDMASCRVVEGGVAVEGRGVSMVATRDSAGCGAVPALLEWRHVECDLALGLHHALRLEEQCACGALLWQAGDTICQGCYAEGKPGTWMGRV